ncbi:MAG TPA: ATP-binding protein [Terriglobales bacterium]
MEQTVRESEERLRLAAQAGRMFAYSWDVATDVIERSGEYAEILGVDPKQETTGVAVSAMVHPDDKEQLETALAKLNVDNPFFQSTYRIIRPDGVVTWLQRSSRAYFNEHGELEHIVGMIADVTERKLAEEALSSVSRRLIQAQEQERTRIARELHDDINQRLAMLQVDLSEVRQSTPASRTDLQDRVEEIRESLSDISEEVQAISHRLHSSKLEYLGLVSACKAFCKELANRQNVRIEFDADGVPSSLLQDVSLTLFRVLQESLQNAIKYSDAEHFEVQLRGTSTEIQLTVRDNGIGFDVDSAMRKQGLGLISMRERANLVGGKIFITSQPMHGTEINVRVPVAVARDPEKVIHNAA